MRIIGFVCIRFTTTSSLSFILPLFGFLAQEKTSRRVRMPDEFLKRYVSSGSYSRKSYGRTMHETTREESLTGSHLLLRRASTVSCSRRSGAFLAANSTSQRPRITLKLCSTFDFDHVDSVVVADVHLSIWYHPTVIEIFRPYLSVHAPAREVGPHNTTPQEVYLLSLQQLEAPSIDCRYSHDAALHSILWHVALLYVRNRVLSNPVQNPDWRFYFDTCVETYVKLYYATASVLASYKG